MKKFSKILFLVLCFVMFASLLTGCKLFSFDSKIDGRKVVVTIKPFDMSFILNDKNNNPKKYNYHTQKLEIHKIELSNVIGSDLSNVTNRSKAEETVKKDLKKLINNRLTLLEIQGKLTVLQQNYKEKYGYNDNPFVVDTIKLVNQKTEVTYNYYFQNNYIQELLKAINADLKTDINEVLTENNQDATFNDGSDQKTTYPVQTTVDNDKEKTKIEYIPNTSDYLLNSSDTKMQKYEILGFRRYIAEQYKKANDATLATNNDKKQFADDKKKIDDYISKKDYNAAMDFLLGIKTDQGERKLNYVSSSLDYSCCSFIKFLYAKAKLENAQISWLKHLYVQNVKISDEMINDYYTDELRTEEEYFNSNQDNYYNFIKTSSNVLFYYPNLSRDKYYFFVKHILIPFSDEQKAELKEQKTKLSEGQYKSFRESLAEQIISYPHVNGENDTTHPMKFKDIYSEVKGIMGPYQNGAHVEEADKTFTKLIYKYNTDPGIFDNERGYRLKLVVNEDNGETEEMQKEFALAARDLYNNKNPGAISDPTITDEGYHILYFSYAPPLNQERVVKINEKSTFGSKYTLYEFIKKQLFDKQSTFEFNKEQDKILAQYKSQNIIKTNNSNLKSFYNSFKK